jgi:hypothetical protein
MAALVDGLGDRLGEHAGPLRDALSQLRVAYVQIKAAAEGGAGDAGGHAAESDGPAPPGT